MTCNRLIISKVRMGGGRNQLCILRTLCVVIVCAFCCAACSKPQPSKAASPASEQPSPVQVRKSLFHNPDSLLYYAALAYKDDDPDGLYVTGAAAYLRAQDPAFPDSCTTVPLSEASIMLKRAAELGQPDAQTLIHCLQESNCWEEENVSNAK